MRATSTTTPAMTSRCTGRSTPRVDSPAPTKAPTNAPPLKAAWNCGMMVRRSLCSTSAPSMFCATSHSPMPMPKKNRDTAVPGIDTAERERAMPTPAAAASIPADRTVWAVPILPTTRPAVGRASREPTAVHSSSVPIWPEVIWRVWVTAGMRAAQLAKTSPLMPKTTNVAAAAAFSPACSSVPVLMLIRSLLPQKICRVQLCRAR